MKKNAFFLIFSFILPGFFACQFSIPTAIEIIGNPSAKFVERVEVGKMFEDLVRKGIDEDERLTMIPCTNDKIEIITNLIHVELINEEYDDLMDRNDIKDIFPDTTLIPDLHIDENTPLENYEILILLDSDDTDIENQLVIPLSELGQILPGFMFYRGDEEDKDGAYEARLYFSGSKIIEKSIIKISVTEVEKGDDGKYRPLENGINKVPIFYDGPENDESDIVKWKKDGYYEGETCPSGGKEIPIPLTGNDIAISFTVYIPPGKTLYLSDFEASFIKVELVVWLPLKFQAIVDGAMLFFPEGYFFNPEKDLFGRKKPDSESLVFDIVENLSVDLNFQKHPFIGGDLIILNKGRDENGEDRKIEDLITFDDEIGEITISEECFTIRNRIEKDNELSFALTEDDLKEINKPENNPFSPDILIGFKDGDKLSFKKDFNAFEFAFKAKIHYRKDF